MTVTARARSCWLTLTVLAVSLVLAGCGVSPADPVRGVLHALDDMRLDKALEYICWDQDVVLISIQDISLQNDTYVVVENSGETAQVQVRGQLRYVSQEGGIGVAARKALDFTVTVRRLDDKWCVDRDSLFASVVGEFVEWH